MCSADESLRLELCISARGGNQAPQVHLSLFWVLWQAFASTGCCILVQAALHMPFSSGIWGVVSLETKSRRFVNGHF